MYIHANINHIYNWILVNEVVLIIKYNFISE
jgi:hypothetical protein